MDQFVSRITELTNIKLKQKSRYDLISTLRLIVFICGAGLSVLLFKNGYTVYGYFSALGFIIIFIILVVLHSSVNRKLKKTICAIKVNHDYIDRSNEKWTEFKDNGEDFIDINHQYSSDLDIFGIKSLFQLINVGHTFFGRKILSELLSKPVTDVDAIIKRQNSVRELISKYSFCEEIQCEGILARDVSNDPSELINYAENTSNIFKLKWMKNTFYILPFLTILSWALFLLKYPISRYIPMGLTIVQVIIMCLGYILLMPTLNTVYKFKNSIEAYKNIFLIIENEDFEDGYLSELRSEFLSNNKKASTRLKGLEHIVDAIDLRYSPIFYVILNIIFLWDYHCIFALEEWRENSGILIGKWFANIGHFEALASLASLLLVNPEWNFPTITKNNMEFSGVEIGHPLILKDKRVNNSIEIKNNLCIVTGSNMSGKTTLLRTIGINLVLAYAGAPICGRSLECSEMEIFTSMRITDDLSSGISTFYAELLRIKMIVEFSKRELPMIFLIDELFRGTNSKDRVIGARSLIKNLSEDWVIGLISTHDFELCDLENELSKVIINYHFSESYLNNKIRFDYKLREGRSNSTNARYLMKMVGIELVD